LGAGFDTRAYRFAGGNWFEVDEPAVISHKDACLPAATCANSLTRIAVDFAAESLEDKLRALPVAGRVIVVMEGVLMYLDEAQMRAAAQTLRRVFPSHLLICDLIRPTFVELYGRRVHGTIRSLWTQLKCFTDEPERFVVGNGYRLLMKRSIIERAVELGGMYLPRFLVRLLRGTLADGFAVCVFQPA
jgi:O-methyltransferase involved in polyketide biosynthesis